MPGFTTHYLFGVDACRRLTSTSMHNMIRRDHSAYALGLQGPDLFFYYLPSYLMHRKKYWRSGTSQGYWPVLCQSAAKPQTFCREKIIPSLLQTLTSVDLWAITHWIVRFIPMYMHLQAIMPRPHLPIRNILVSMLISKRNSIPNFYMRKSICILPSFIRTQRFV